MQSSEVEEIRDRDDRTAIRKLKGTEAIDFALHVGLGAGILEQLCGAEAGRMFAGRDRESSEWRALPKVVPLPGLFCGAERQWYRGLLLLENEIVPL